MPYEEMNLRVMAEAMGVELDDLVLRTPRPIAGLRRANESVYERAARAWARIRKWDLRHLKVARDVAAWSKDPSTQVGALVTTPDNRPVSWGFNGFPMGVDDDPERYANRELKYDLIVHGEINALTFAGERAKGCTLYTWPFPPCVRCAGIVIQFGIRRVVAPVISPELEARWGQACARARMLFSEAGLEQVSYREDEIG